MGVGNFIDTFARYLGVPFPGGPEIEKLAKQSTNYVELPYSIKGTDVANTLSQDTGGGLQGIAADVSIIREILQKGGGGVSSMASDALQSGADMLGNAKGVAKGGRFGGLLKAGGKLLKGGLIGATLGLGADFLVDKAVDNGAVSDRHR
jgi:hypothetical protein